MGRRPKRGGERGDADPIVVDTLVANQPYVDPDEGYAERETRGDRKRKAEQLERLGESLVTLPDVKLARVPLPDDLAAAVREARRIREKTSARGGYRRQVQFIGRIMRTLDARPIAEALEAMKQEDAPSSAAFQHAERWRDRLIAGDDADLDALIVELPPESAADRTAIRQLIRQAQKETREHKPPHASRALFRMIRPLFLG